MLRKIIIFVGMCIIIGLIVRQNIDAHSNEADKNSRLMQETIQGQAKDTTLHGQAATFALIGLDGQAYGITADVERPKPLMLNFWASWCGPCEEEAPELQKVYDKYKTQFDLYSVNATSKDKLKNAKDFVKRYGLTFPILLDSKGEAQDLYRISFIPTSYLIDRNGKIVDFFHIIDAKELDAKIKKLISG